MGFTEGRSNYFSDRWRNCNIGYIFEAFSASFRATGFGSASKKRASLATGLSGFTTLLSTCFPIRVGKNPLPIPITRSSFSGSNLKCLALLSIEK